MINKEHKRDLKISGTGICLGEVKVSDLDLDNKLSLPPGTILKKTGVKYRYRQPDRNTPHMGAEAVKRALEDAHWDLSTLDAIISTSAVSYTPIPCNAVRIQKELNLGNSGISCFDVNATCLGFFIAFDLASLKIACGLWDRVVLVSTESSHTHLNKNHLESYGLFGDGAVAVCLERGDGKSYVLSSCFESYGDYLNLCKVTGGTVALPAQNITSENELEYYFNMSGRKLFKFSSLMLKQFCDRAFKAVSSQKDKFPHSFADIDLVIPHQASVSAMELVRRKLQIPSEKWMQIIEDYGNCISASVPMALHVARTTHRISSGQNIFLLGTGAGLSLGAIIFRL